MKKFDDIGASVAILRRGTNSGQAFTKYRDLPTMLKPLPSENCHNLTMKLEVKYDFPTSIFQLFQFSIVDKSSMRWHCF